MLNEFIVEDLQADLVTGLDIVGLSSRVGLGALVAAKVVPISSCQRAWLSRIMNNLALRVDNLHEGWHVGVGILSNIFVLSTDLLSVVHHCGPHVSACHEKRLDSGSGSQMLKM